MNAYRFAILLTAGLPALTVHRHGRGPRHRLVRRLPELPGPRVPAGLSDEYEQRQATSYRLEYETAYEDRRETRYRPVYETQLRERRYTVTKPILETAEREERFTVMKPVCETQVRDESYDVVQYGPGNGRARRAVYRQSAGHRDRRTRSDVHRPAAGHGNRHAPAMPYGHAAGRHAATANSWTRAVITNR